ncbi:hypothetical protein IPA_05850 [Ignicoccus pacificus DSM 13166]|uniref:Uncharacterized protein n=1 Tax=Ignicoccus pacificus DSM 13166 TaxID=940294 RepID=A0A977KBE1_9CREN|nr:hypothetical protein IPA_05850 [Ignicoccus pacificus DSM 13166]
MEQSSEVPLRGLERLFIPFLVSLPIGFGVGTYFLIAYWGTPYAWRGFFGAVFSRAFYYTIMGALGSFLMKEAGTIKAYVLLGLVLVAINFMYRFYISVFYDIAFVASMIMILSAAIEESK